MDGGMHGHAAKQTTTTCSQQNNSPFLPTPCLPVACCPLTPTNRHPSATPNPPKASPLALLHDLWGHPAGGAHKRVARHHAVAPRAAALQTRTKHTNHRSQRHGRAGLWGAAAALWAVQAAGRLPCPAAMQASCSQSCEVPLFQLLGLASGAQRAQRARRLTSRVAATPKSASSTWPLLSSRMLPACVPVTARADQTMEGTSCSALGGMMYCVPQQG